MPTTRGLDKALVVDGDASEAKMLEGIVAKAGYGCTTTSSGEEALSLLGDENYVLLVVSRSLDDITGIEIARLARNLNPLVPILIVTYGFDEPSKEMSVLGRANYITRPLEADMCERQIHQMVGSARPSRAPAKVDASSVNSLKHTVSEALADKKTEKNPRVLIIESEIDIQNRISETLEALGCEVATYTTLKDADAILNKGDFDVLVAGANVLRGNMDQLMRGKQSDYERVSLAIMDSGGMDRAIEAIQLGAQGVFFPPFERDRVSLEFRRAVGWQGEK